MDRFIQTYTGGQFFINNPSVDSISILDIAHALSQICRFTGHTRGFYSVAEHSVRVAWTLPEELKLMGLLHDAPEAYLGDVNSPLKHYLPDYRKIENKVWRAISEKWGLPFKLPVEVKWADILLLSTEKRDLMGEYGHRWSDLPDPQPRPIIPWSSGEAEAVFLSYYYQVSRTENVHIADR